MMHARILIAALLIIGTAHAASQSDAPQAAIDPAAGARFAGLALKCLHQEYPTHLSSTMDSDADALPPRKLNPAFHGCFDWHSDVHGHWLLVRLLRTMPDAPGAVAPGAVAPSADAPFAPAARTALAITFTPENIAGEVAYLRREGRASFERPYGLAWLLKLSAELRQWNDPQGQEWSATLRPLEAEAASRIKSWLPKLHYPIRIGEHDQTAFSFGLIWDWAGIADDAQMRALLTDAGNRFYAADRDCPLSYEPSGQDFLSPCLAEADFMRRVMAPPAFARWLSTFLPTIPRNAHAVWLSPAVVTDRADPKLAHLDGLNLSRSWMLEGIAHGLPPQDPRIPALRAAADAHAAAALPQITGEHYEGGHWLGTFAVYLTSQAGAQAR